MAEQEGEAHPGVAQYVEIGVILAVLTAIEVVLYEAMRRGMMAEVAVPGILVITALKFVLVVLWFMHLRFDHKLFRRVFAAGIAIATTVFGAVAAMFFL